MFDESFDYVALGHLHVPQRVGGREHIRYSGSPIAMGFGEAKQQKQVLLVKFGAADNVISDLDVTPDNYIPQLINTDSHIKTTKVEKSVEKTVKKVAIQAEPLMDDLFGFDEPSANENDEVAETDVTENTPAQHEPNNQSLPTHAATANKILHHDNLNQMQVVSLPIPKFQKLAQVSGDLASIHQAIDKAIQSLDSKESVWLEVIYTGDDIVSELREHIQAMVEGLPCEVLKIKNTQTYNKVLNQQQTSETLQDLNEEEVFERCLTAHSIPDEQKSTLRDAYDQIVYNLRHADSHAE
jgi:exonuclease SbcD